MAERRQVLDDLIEPRFADVALDIAYDMLLDERIYHCSERTIYHVLIAVGEVR